MSRDRFRTLVAEMASPEALRDNPFRLLDLPTDVSGRELRREAERRRILQQVSAPDPGAAGDQGDASVEALLRRLRDPAYRLVYELLWHWPGDADAGTGHNAAVAELEAFLDAPPETAGAACRRAIEAADRSLTAPATADHLARRAEAIDDPRVSAGDARTLADEARRLVPLLALRMAVAAQRHGDATLALRLADAVRQAATPTAARAVTEEVLAPIIAGVRTEADTAVRAARATPARAAAQADELLEHTRSDRALVEALLRDEADPLRVGLADDLTEKLLECITLVYAEGPDHQTAHRLLTVAASLRPSPGLRAEVDRLLESVSMVIQFEAVEQAVQQAVRQQEAARQRESSPQAWSLQASQASQAPPTRQVPRERPTRVTGPPQTPPWGTWAPPPDPTQVLGQRVGALVVDYLGLALLATVPSVGGYLCLAAFVLFVVILQGLTGASVGKGVFGVRVVRPDGRRPGLARSAVRALPWLGALGVATLLEPADGYVLVFGVEGAVAALTRGRRRLGDLMAGTFVVRASDAGAPVPLPPPARPLAGRVARAATALGVGVVLMLMPVWTDGYSTGEDREETEAGQDTETASPTTTTRPRSTTTTTARPATTTTTAPPTTPATPPPDRTPEPGECARPDPDNQPNGYLVTPCGDPAATVQVITTLPGFAVSNASRCPADTDVVLEYQETTIIGGASYPSLIETWCARNV